MLRLLVVSCIIAAAAHAQERPRERPTTGQRVVLVLGAVGGGLTAGFVGPFVPVPVALATFGTSAALGLHPSVGGVLVDTAAGTLVGAVVAVGTHTALTEIGGAPGDLGTALGSFALGVAAGSVTTGLVHGARVHVAPAALAAATGERGVGLALRLGL